MDAGAKYFLLGKRSLQDAEAFAAGLSPSTNAKIRRELDILIRSRSTPPPHEYFFAIALYHMLPKEPHRRAGTLSKRT